MTKNTQFSWACGVTTVKSRIENGLLKKTLRSLHNAGFPDPRVFIDGPCDIPPWLRYYPITQRLPNIKCAGNWILSAWELFIRNPDADYYGLFQDDILCVSHIREYLENIKFPEKGYLNLYTHPKEKKNFPGQFYKSRQKGKGALALIFSHESMKLILSAEHMVNRTCGDKARRTKVIDGGIVETFRKAKGKEWVHNPSLVYHLGEKSTISCGGHPQAWGFPGESFDARDFLKGDEGMPGIKTVDQALDHMISPGKPRSHKANRGIIQILVSRACDHQCYGCTQGSQLKGPPRFISQENFEKACISLKSYYGTVGIFGGNPCLHPKFPDLCEILRKYIPFKRRGLWTNNLNGHGKVVRETFNPAISNVNVHVDARAAEELRQQWPKVKIHGKTNESRHSPPFVAMRDIMEPEEYWPLVPDCDIHRYWSAILCEFRGTLKAYFCEIAGAQAVLHQDEPDYPDLGIDPIPGWWNRPIRDFHDQVEYHCSRCGIPLRIHGSLSQGPGKEQVSRTHKDIFLPRESGRDVELITSREQITSKNQKVTSYIQKSTERH